MSIFGRANIQGTSVKSFKLTGGLNEQVTSLELSAGELYRCKNYVEKDDRYHGYESTKGYERFNGMTSPSSVALDSIDPVVDTSREAARTAITAVPGTGDIRGVHIYNDKVYAWRDNAGGTAKDLYVSDATHGWSDGTTPDTPITDSTPVMDNGGTVRAVTGRFALYQSNAEVMVWVDGVSQPKVWNGTDVSTINIGTILGSPFDATYPTHVGIWQNRMFLAYANGHILFSEVGDPTAWSSATGNAGEIFIGAEITGIIEAPGGSLLFFTQNTIKMLSYGSTSDEFIFKLDDFPRGIGARENTVESLTGSIYFADDRGFSVVEASAESGGLSANIIGKKVQETYLANISTITGSAVDRNTNRYYLFYNDSVSSLPKVLVFTFFNKRLKGVGILELDDEVTAVAEGSFSDGTNKIFFGSDDGYVYHFLSGTSFDGGVIATSLSTSYHHYGSPRSWKRFRRLTMEIDADNGTVFTISGSFDYDDTALKKPIDNTATIARGGSLWGSAIWGSFVWGTDLLTRQPIYTNGYGSNMSVNISTSSKYKTEHTIHNITTDFSVKGIQNG